MPLDALNHDILISIFTILSISEILHLRQASRQLYLVSEEYAVWKTACTNEILRNGIPFPKRSLTSFSPKDLERQTLLAYKLGLNWRSPYTRLHYVVSSPTECGAIEEIKFLSRLGQTWIVTTSIGIWWTLRIRECKTLRVMAHWSPERAVFNGMAVNTDEQSDGAIAVSVHRVDCTTVEILAISEDDVGGIEIQSRRTLESSYKPIAFHGDIVALCDHDSETLILNWKTQEQALLKSPDTWQDRPLRVIFAHGHIFVVRGRSICIFEKPKMVSPGDSMDVVLPCITQSFGWVDGVSLAMQPSALFGPADSSQPRLTLLVRKKGGDPWRPTEQFQIMALNADFDHIPHPASQATSSTGDESSPVPFTLIATLTSPHHGPFRCSDVVLGPYGTAVWVQPSNWAAAGLITDDNVAETLPSTASHETLVVALFPGSLNQGLLRAQFKVVLENGKNGWSCLDYDEARGLIALGTSSGEVTVYRL